MTVDWDNAEICRWATSVERAEPGEVVGFFRVVKSTNGPPMLRVKELDAERIHAVEHELKRRRSPRRPGLWETVALACGKTAFRFGKART